MANADRPRGFWPKGTPSRVNVYQSGGAVYPGDFVAFNSSGLIVAAAAGGKIYGLSLGYCAASGADILVCDDPDQLYVGQCDAGAVDAQTDIGNVADIKATTGNTTYKTSRHEFDDATLSASGSAQLTLVAIETRPDNALGANCTVIVRVNESQQADSFAGV